MKGKQIIIILYKIILYINHIKIRTTDRTDI